MAQFRRTTEADEDIDAIWYYTEKRWGRTQADAYFRLIEAYCLRLAKGELKGKKISDEPKIYSLRCEHHYILYTVTDTLLVLAVFHEKMNVLARLQKRLTP